MKLKIKKAWFESRARLEGDLEIGCGSSAGELVVAVRRLPLPENDKGASPSGAPTSPAYGGRTGLSR
jgi:hypothetical protein